MQWTKAMNEEITGGDYMPISKLRVPMKLQLFSEEGNEDLEQTQEQTDTEVEFDIEAFKQFAESNPDARAYIQQSTQAKIDKGVQTMFENKKEDLIAEAKLEASNLSPQEKDLARMRQELDAIKRDKAISDNRTLVLQELDDIELPSDVKPYVRQMALDLVDTDYKKSSEMLGNLSTIIEKISETTTRQATYDSVGQLNQIRDVAKPSESTPQKDMIDPTSYGKAEIGRAIFGK